MKTFCVNICAMLVLALFVGGCDNQKAAGLDEVIYAPPPQASAAPANDGERILPTYEEANNEDGPLDFLAFWEWGSDENQSSEPPRIDERRILGNLSPEMTSRHDTPGEIDIQISKTFDHDSRAIWDDIMYHLMLDRPTKLSMDPTP